MNDFTVNLTPDLSNTKDLASPTPEAVKRQNCYIDHSQSGTNEELTEGFEISQTMIRGEQQHHKVDMELMEELNIDG